MPSAVKVAFARQYLLSIGNKHPNADSLQKIIECVENPQGLDYLLPFARQFKRWLEGVFETTCECCEEVKDCTVKFYGELQDDYEFLCAHCRGLPDE